MAKKVKQPKETRLEDILLDCRNSLRGSASMTEKRDLLLTLVFLKFLYEKFKKQQHIIMERYKDNEGLAKLMLDQPSAYEQDGVFYLPEKCRWDLLLDVSATSLAVELDNALTELNKIERLKGSAPTQIFTGIIETLYEIFHGEVVDVIYYNSLGMSSKTPFDGINIVVTRYSDGTTSTTKVMR